jgi:hypothetical protein
MKTTHVTDGIALLEKANAGLQPELMSDSDVRDMFAEYARAEKLAAFGKAVLARRMDASAVAKVTGTSVGKAKSVVETSKALETADEVRSAFQGGRISLDQASEIARAEVAQPKSESFQVLREKARRVVLEAEQHRGLGERQRKIPGIGPVPPEVAKAIAEDAFLTGVFFDGKGPASDEEVDENYPGIGRELRTTMSLVS